ncbi:MAG: hypothetical protein ACXAES_12660 [Promethearchaeota archaeon]|jgi:hypothetical protein
MIIIQIIDKGIINGLIYKVSIESNNMSERDQIHQVKNVSKQDKHLKRLIEKNENLKKEIKSPLVSQKKQLEKLMLYKR